MEDDQVLFVRSIKKEKSNGDMSGSDDEEDEDVWDDRVLINAFDKAVELAENEALKKMNGASGRNGNCKNKKKFQWKIGDRCTCEYSEDLKYYEADIIDMVADAGMCTVKYVGYENEEEVPIDKLKPSKGEKARKNQIQQASLEMLHNVGRDKNVEESNFEGQHQFREKKMHRRRKMRNSSSSKSKNDFASAAFDCHMPQSSINMSIPPPPPPHVFDDDDKDITESESMSAMLMSWYMTGYHTGFYQGLKAAKKNSRYGADGPC